MATWTPIIRSLCDLDLYKLTMLQIAWRRYARVPVTFGFTNRTKRVRVADIVAMDDLRRELEHIRSLRFAEHELEFLKSMGYFCDEFLGFLRTLELASIHITRRGDGQYDIRSSGDWVVVTLWETLTLSVVNELYFRAIVRESGKTLDEIYAEGNRRLDAKIAALRELEATKGIVAKIIEFGTRRRFSSWWQWYVLARLKREVSRNLVGTSNVSLAMRLGLKPIGTFAHEMPMVYSGIYRDDLRASHNRMLREWEEEYAPNLLIALTDTYTSAFFFEDMTAEQARTWSGLRHDSGDPFDFGEHALAFYGSHGVDPRTKTLVFSDGLDVTMILRLIERFAGRINLVFGWGTNLTNDLGFDALSLIMKAIEANGHGTVKLTDNLAKAQGAPEDVVVFTREFGHQATTTEECRY